MHKYVLVYRNKECEELGGGTFVEYPDSIPQMTKIVNDLNSQFGVNLEIVCAVEVCDEITFEPVEKVVVFEARSLRIRENKR